MLAEETVSSSYLKNAPALVFEFEFTSYTNILGYFV